MVEAIFGAEESQGHRLRTRFRTDGSRERWGPALAVGWNLRVLNRLRCAKSLGMEVGRRSLTYFLYDFLILCQRPNIAMCCHWVWSLLENSLE
jgi:hypothetical protein